MKLKELLELLNQKEILEKLMQYGIYGISITQENTYRPIGCLESEVTHKDDIIIYTDYEICLPYKGLDISEANIKAFHLYPNAYAEIEIHKDCIPDDSHIPVYYAKGVYAGQDVLYLIAKDYYDDMTARDKDLEVLYFDEEYRQAYEESNMNPYYDDHHNQSAVLYEYYYEIEKAVNSWQNVMLQTWHNVYQKMAFTGSMTALSRPIPEIIKLMRKQGFDLEPMPKSFKRGKLLKLKIIEKDKTERYFLISVCNINNNIDPDIQTIQADIIKYNEFNDCQSAEDVIKFIPDDLSDYEGYYFESRQMDPETENCTNPDITIKL